VNVSEASRHSGVTPKMVRYYEEIGLLQGVARRDNGYRDYAEDDVHRLVFVRRARELGFPVERIRALLSLWSERDRSNEDVRAVALSQIGDLEGQAQKLNAMIATLRQLVGACRKGNRPDCPIIAELSGEGAKPSRVRSS
jgi:MerR family transcriptional regulator, copper efflux regulator